MLFFLGMISPLKSTYKSQKAIKKPLSTNLQKPKGLNKTSKHVNQQPQTKPRRATKIQGFFCADFSHDSKILKDLPTSGRKYLFILLVDKHRKHS